MNLLYLKMKGFRKYKAPFEVKFDKETYIIGGNAKGKSTIAYAIAWTFLGTDLRGNSKVSMINKDSMECYTEIGFIGNDDKEHVLARYKHREYSKSNFISLDGKFVKQEDLKSLYRDAPLFLSVFNSDYFRDLEPAKQKELINKYLPKVEFDDVFNKLSAEEKKNLIIPYGNINRFIEGTRQDIKEAQKEIDAKKGKIEYAENIAKETLEDRKEFLKQEEIDLLEQERDFLQSENNQALREELYNKIQGKQAEVMNFENKLDKINESGRKARLQYNLISSSNNTSNCPCCGQVLDDKAKVNALNSKKEEMFKLADEKKEYEEKIANLKIEVTTLKARLLGLGTVRNTDRINEIDDRLNELEKEKAEIVGFNRELEIKKETIKNAKKDIVEMKERIKAVEKEIAEYNRQITVAQKLFCMMVEEKIKIAEEYLPNAKIQFYELIQSTGELKDCFKITRNGEEFSSLSKSQKFVTVLEICNMLNKITGLNIPLVIDDSESYPDYNFRYDDYKSQLIIIRAKKNRALKICKEQETISNVKTLNINKKQLSEVA